MISIEGNIGSGKSTIIEKCKNFLEKKTYMQHPDKFSKFMFLKDQHQIDKISFVKEPIEKWLNTIDECDGDNILDKFYKDQRRWGYSFQMNAFITKSKQILNLISKNHILITERSINSDNHVFTSILLEDKIMSNIEKKLYSEWYYWIKDSFNINDPNHYIYLKVDPEVALSRIKKRSRDEENEVSIEYLKKIEIKHDEWLLNLKNTTIINLNDDTNSVNDIEIIYKILEVIDNILSNDKSYYPVTMSIKDSLDSNNILGYRDEKYKLNPSKSAGKFMVFYLIPTFLVLILGYMLQTTVFDFDIYF